VFFAELKAFVRHHWKFFEDNPEQGFDSFLEWCLETVGVRGKSVKGHFRNAVLTIEEL
jgi:hypothetical protein